MGKWTAIWTSYKMNLSTLLVDISVANLMHLVYHLSFCDRLICDRVFEWRQSDKYPVQFILLWTNIVTVYAHNLECLRCLTFLLSFYPRIGVALIVGALLASWMVDQLKAQPNRDDNTYFWGCADIQEPGNSGCFWLGKRNHWRIVQDQPRHKYLGHLFRSIRQFWTEKLQWRVLPECEFLSDPLSKISTIPTGGATCGLEILTTWV